MGLIRHTLEPREFDMTAYVFPGISRFLDQVATAEAHDHSDLRYRGQSHGLQVAKAQDSWHLKRLADALGQLPAMLPQDRAGKIEHIEEIMASLRIACKAAEAAIKEVFRAIEAQERVSQPPPSPSSPKKGK